MTAKEIADNLGLEILCMPDPEREVHGAYSGDLLSWVMGRAEEGNVWITIMTNVNVVAVASLVGMSAVIICDNSEIDNAVVSKANEKSVNLFRCKMPSYETCVLVAGLVK